MVKIVIELDMEASAYDLARIIQEVHNIDSLYIEDVKTVVD